MKQFNLKTDLLLTAAAGGLTGLVVQAAQDGCGGFGLTAHLMEAFGTVSFGFLPWVVTASALSLHSRCGLHAALRVFSFFAALLAGYAFGTVFFGGWCNETLLFGGTLLLLPAVLAGWFVRATRGNGFARFLTGAAGIAALLIDFDYHGGFTGREWKLALPLLVFHFYTVSLFRKRKPAAPVHFEYPRTYTMYGK